MTTHKSDVLVLNITLGRFVLPLVDLGFEWPPPDRLYIDPDPDIGLREATDEDDLKHVLVCTQRSQLPDEFSSPHVARAAEYRYLEETS